MSRRFHRDARVLGESLDDRQEGIGGERGGFVGFGVDDGGSRGFIGIDSGTQSTKAVVLDLEQKKVIAEARAPHHLIAGLPVGHMEQHPQEWTAALDGDPARSRPKSTRSRVRGIGVSGQQHGFVPLDEKGEVIRPAKLWCDTSTVPECALLTKKLGGAKAAIRQAGLLFLPGFTAPKILWLKRHEPQNYRRLRHVLLPHDYLNFTSPAITSWSTATRPAPR
jgi:xylulokinase